MTDFTIRKIENRDFSVIAALEKECFEDAVGESAIKDLFSCGGFGYIAESEGKICGFLYCADAAGDSELLRIAVSKEHRRSGIGKALAKMLVLETSGSIFLEVRESNTPARSLYLSLGFAESGIRKNFYKNPTENAILMTKTK